MHRVWFLAGLLLFLISAGLGFAQLPGTVSFVNQGGGAPSCIPFDNNVMGMYHFEGNAVDASRRGHNGTLSASGASYSSAQAKFGTQSLLISTMGTGQVTVPANTDWAFGTGNFTWEWWGYLNSTTTYQAAFGDYSTNSLIEETTSASNMGFIVGNGTFTTYTTGPFPKRATNRWQHNALVRSGTTLTLYLDGTVTATFASMGGNMTNTTGSAWSFGNLGSANANYVWNGYLDEFRISNIARYTAAFVPPTVPFCDPTTNYVGIGDISPASAWWGLRAYNKAAVAASAPLVNVRRASDSATCDVLAGWPNGDLGITSGCSTGTNNNLSFNAFCGPTCFVTKLYDQSGAKQCGGAACDAIQATTANQPAINGGCFGGMACISPVNASSNLASPAGPTVAQPFTVHGLAQRNGAVTTRGTFYQQGTGPQFSFTTTANQVGITNAGASFPTATASDYVTHSVSGIWNGATTSIVVDSTTTPGSIETTSATGTFNVGPGSSANTLTGNVSEIGVWPSTQAANISSFCDNEYGVAFGTACGTRPACTPNTVGGDDSNVVALWHMDNNGNDVSLTGNHTLGLNGGATYSQVQSRFGGYALYIPTAATSYAQTPATGNITFPAGQDFTIEGWVWFGGTTFPSYYGWIGDDQVTSISGANPSLFFQTSAAAYSATSAKNITTSLTTIGQWMHIAYVRQGGNFTFYINGLAQDTPLSLALNGVWGAATGNTPQKIGRGYSSSYVMPSGSYIDEVRISNVARYSGTSFTPPKSAFCNPVPPVSAYNGPGDAVTGATAWWGLRAYSKNIATNWNVAPTKVANIRRSGDGVTCDVNAAFNGGLGVTANCSNTSYNAITANAFCTSTCFVTKLYDQSGANSCGGAACDVAQATSGNQPALQFGCEANNACLVFSSNTQNLVSATGPSIAAPYTFAAWGKRTGAFTSYQALAAQSSSTLLGYNNVANQARFVNNGVATTVAATDSVAHSIAASVYAGPNFTFAVDTTFGTGLTPADATSTSGTFFVGAPTTGFGLTGTVAEAGVWPKQFASTDQSALCDNQYGYIYGTACGVIPPCTANNQGGGTFANVMALWHFDGNLNDSSGKNHNGTAQGPAGASTTQSKFGGSSLFLSNQTTSVSNVLIPDTTGNFGFGTGDFTVEMWQYVTGSVTTGHNAWWSCEPTDSGGCLDMVLQNYSTPNAQYHYIGGTAPVSGLPTLNRVQNTWMHYAIVRQGGNIYTYENGTRLGTGAAGAGAIAGTWTQYIIGGYTPTAYLDYNFPGYFDEMRISNIARYTANFTPAISAFCNN